MADADNTIQVQPRTPGGGRAARKVREQGRIPAIVYGNRKDAAAVSVDQGAMLALLHTGTQLAHVAGDGGAAELVLIKEVQWDPMGGRILHVDFNRVDVNRKVRVQVPLELKGKPAGAEEGGVLDQVLLQIEVECLPLDIPKEPIRASAAEMKVGDIMHVRDVRLPPKLTAITGPDTVVATVKIPLETVEPAPVEGAAAEPEVIAKGKIEEEGAEGEAAPAAGGAAAAPAAKDKKAPADKEKK
jgi:large subunit ribosomal protein L25